MGGSHCCEWFRLLHSGAVAIVLLPLQNKFPGDFSLREIYSVDIPNQKLVEERCDMIYCNIGLWTLVYLEYYA